MTHINRIHERAALLLRACGFGRGHFMASSPSALVATRRSSQYSLYESIIIESQGVKHDAWSATACVCCCSHVFFDGIGDCALIESVNTDSERGWSILRSLDDEEAWLSKLIISGPAECARFASRVGKRLHSTYAPAQIFANSTAQEIEHLSRSDLSRHVRKLLTSSGDAGRSLYQRVVDEHNPNAYPGPHGDLLDLCFGIASCKLSGRWPLLTTNESIDDEAAYVAFLLFDILDRA